MGKALLSDILFGQDVNLMPSANLKDMGFFNPQRSCSKAVLPESFVCTSHTGLTWVTHVTNVPGLSPGLIKRTWRGAPWSAHGYRPHRYSFNLWWTDWRHWPVWWFGEREGSINHHLQSAYYLSDCVKCFSYFTEIHTSALILWNQYANLWWEIEVQRVWITCPRSQC